MNVLLPFMATHPTQAALPNDPGHQAANTHAHLQVLNDLIEMGADLARLLHTQAKAQAATKPPSTAPAALETLIAITTAFDRIARSVRRSITLARILAQPPPPAKDPAAHRTATRKRIIREVEDAIGRNTDTPDPAGLTAELYDRLDTPDLDDGLASRPTADIITEICRDLGLAALPGTQPWRRRTPADLQDLATRAAAPSGPRQPGAAHPINRPTPTKPAATPYAAPTQTPADHDPPDHAAEVIAKTLRQPTYIRARWHPPPGA